MKKTLLIFFSACAFTSVDARLTKGELNSTIYHSPSSYTAMGSIQTFRELLASDQHKSNKDNLDVLGDALAEFIAHGTIENPKGTYTPPGNSRLVQKARINQNDITDLFKVLLSASGKMKNNGLTSLSDRFNQLYIDETDNRIQRHIRGAIMLASLAENTIVSVEKTLDSVYHHVDESLKKFAAFSGQENAPEHHFDKILNPLAVMDEMRNAAKRNAQSNLDKESEQPSNKVDGDRVKLDRGVLEPKKVTKKEKQEKITPQRYNNALDAKMRPYKDYIRTIASNPDANTKLFSQNILKIIRYFFLYDLDPHNTPTKTEIIIKFKELSRIYHPDKNDGNAGYTEFFQNIQDGYATLLQIANNEAVTLLKNFTWEQAKNMIRMENLLQPQQNEQNSHSSEEDSHSSEEESNHQASRHSLSFPSNLTDYYQQMQWAAQELRNLENEFNSESKWLPKRANLNNLIFRTQDLRDLLEKEVGKPSTPGYAVTNFQYLALVGLQLINKIKNEQARWDFSRS